MGTYGTAVYGTAVYGGTDPEPPASPGDGLVPVRVELAFGFGPGDTPTDADWIDVTDDVDATFSSADLVARTGRDNIRAGITPGRVEFSLENIDGKYNPDNPDGPYYGLLDNGTQVRVSTTWDDTTAAVWTGFIDSGWPQQVAARFPYVELTAHDVAGLAAASPPPATAWDDIIARSAPDHWLEPSAADWIDRSTGLAIRHTSRLAQADTADEAIIDGAAAPFAQADPDGYGFTDDATFQLSAAATALTVLARVRLATEADRLARTGIAGDYVTLIRQDDTSGARPPLVVRIHADRLTIEAHTPTVRRTATTSTLSPELAIMDGDAHTVAVHVPAGTGAILAWIDGRPLTLVTTTTAVGAAVTPAGLYIGAEPAHVKVPVNPSPYIGAIDPLVVWRSAPAADLDAWAAETHAAAVLAWAGDRLDQRVERLAAACGIDAHLGDLDTSGIITLQGYRADNPVALLQTIEDTEQGRVWVDGTGQLRFSRRSWAWDDTDSSVVQLTFSDDPTMLAAGDAFEMLEGGTVLADDPLNVITVAQVTSENGRQQTSENAAARAKYGRRNVVTLSGLLHPSDRQSRAIADWLVLSQGAPPAEVQQLAFRVENDPDALAPFAQQVHEGTLVRIVKLADGADLDVYAHVIAVEHRFNKTGWTVVLTLDNTRTGFEFFEWGTSTWDGAAGWAF